jgi:hypothetical protein
MNQAGYMTLMYPSSIMVLLHIDLAVICFGIRGQGQDFDVWVLFTSLIRMTVAPGPIFVFCLKMSPIFR